MHRLLTGEGGRGEGGGGREGDKRLRKGQSRNPLSTLKMQTYHIIVFYIVCEDDEGEK